MSKKLFRKIAAIAAAMTMAVSSMAICANAQEYQEVTNAKTSGGDGGKATVHCYVFKTHYSKTQGAPERTAYGVHGNLCKDLITNWTASGKVFTNTLDFDVTGSAKSSNSYSASRVETGLNQSTVYVTYALTMKCSNTAFGSYTYTRNGAF